ncbi:MAG: hypothetical protein ACLTMP_06160 [Eggerthella lenta]
MSEEDEISSKRARCWTGAGALLIGAGSTAALLDWGVAYAGTTRWASPGGGRTRLVSACIRCEKCYEHAARHHRACAYRGRPPACARPR